MRDLTKDEVETAIDQLIALSARTCLVAARSPDDVTLATLADLA